MSGDRADLEKVARGATTVSTDPIDDKIIIDVEYAGFDGKPLKGVFTFRRPVAGDQVEVGSLAANLARGAKWESIPPNNRECIMAVATCLQFLCDPKPEWFKLDGSPIQFGDDLVVALAEQFRAELIRTFRGGEGDPGTTPERPRMVVRPRVREGAPNPGAGG